MPDVSGVCRAVRLIVLPRIPAMDRCLMAWGAVYSESRNNSSASHWIAWTNSESSAAPYFSTLRSFSLSLTTNVSMSNAFATAVGGTPTVSRRSMISVNSLSSMAQAFHVHSNRAGVGFSELHGFVALGVGHDEHDSHLPTGQELALVQGGLETCP